LSKIVKSCQKLSKEKMSKCCQKVGKSCQKVVKNFKKMSKKNKIVKKCQNMSKSCQKMSKSCQKSVKNLFNNLSRMFLKNLSIICHFAQIVRGRKRRRRRRRLVAPRPGGDFVAPGKNVLERVSIKNTIIWPRQSYNPTYPLRERNIGVRDTSLIIKLVFANRCLIININFF
jgi:hypothetical protein